jgi:60 kDa SS-A/Ro ribonucleoprotein
MSKLNVKIPFNEKTYEGASAARMTNLQALRRSVASCFLWEKEFYEDGQTIADRIETLAAQCTPTQVAALAIEARNSFGLRHAPLLLLCTLAKTASGTSLLSDTMPSVIKRADELTEFVAMYWRKGKIPLSKQVKLGLAKSFLNFDEYQLAKYNRDGAVKLRDVLFLSHAKPDTPEREALWKRLADNELVTPDTWEVALSAGADKKETFERLILENKLGYLALLRNLRNMIQANVSTGIIREALAKGYAGNVLPFRFVAAARAAPRLEPAIDEALIRRVEAQAQFDGATWILVDVSGSMSDKLSAKSDMTRMDAAATLASVFPGDKRVFTFSTQMVEVPPRKGMAGVDSIIRSQPHGGTYLGQALTTLYSLGKFDRLIVITDEQTVDRIPDPVCGKAYMINVASAKNGVGYGKWTHIDGFSENVFKFIAEHEAG